MCHLNSHVVWFVLFSVLVLWIGAILVVVMQIGSLPTRLCVICDLIPILYIIYLCTLRTGMFILHCKCLLIPHMSRIPDPYNCPDHVCVLCVRHKTVHTPIAVACVVVSYVSYVIGCCVSHSSCRLCIVSLCVLCFIVTRSSLTVSVCQFYAMLLEHVNCERVSVCHTHAYAFLCAPRNAYVPKCCVICYCVL